MFKRVLIVLTSAILLLSPTFASAQTANAQLTGTVAYRERIALPSDAVFDVQLLDTSLADVAAQTVAEVLINAEGRQVPVPFTLTYDPAKIVPTHRYSVRATIRSGDGMLMFSSTQAYPVLTHGTPSKVNLILHTVGHGAKPGASAKKQVGSTPAESAVSASQPSPSAASESATPVTTPAASSSEPAPSGMTPSTQEPLKPLGKAQSSPPENDDTGIPSTPVVVEPESVPQTSSTIPQSAMTTKESTPSETVPPAESSSPVPAPQNVPPAQETAPPAPAATEQQAPPAESSALAAPEAPTAQPESKPAEAQTPEPTAPTPETKAAEPEPPLPEAPSASKRAELEAATPESAEPESTSRPERPAPNKAVTPLADTQWKLIQLNGQDVVIVPPQKPVTLAFSPEGRRIAGSAGCNSYLGTFTDDHGRLHLSPGNMTMMICADPAGSRERKFVAMLRSADGYKINGDFLLLTSSGKTVAKFKKNQF
jgi:putative lipoprotein